MKVRAAIGCLVAGAALLGACGDDDTSTADDVAQLCEDMSALQSTLDGITGGDIDLTNITRNDVSTALDTLQSEVEAVQSAAVDVSDSVKSDLQDALDSFRSALEAIPSGDSTLAEAGAAAQTASSDFRTAWDATLAELNCS